MLEELLLSSFRVYSISYYHNKYQNKPLALVSLGWALSSWFKASILLKQGPLAKYLTPHFNNYTNENNNITNTSNIFTTTTNTTTLSRHSINVKVFGSYNLTKTYILFHFFEQIQKLRSVKSKKWYRDLCYCIAFAIVFDEVFQLLLSYLLHRKYHTNNTLANTKKFVYLTKWGKAEDCSICLGTLDNSTKLVCFCESRKHFGHKTCLLEWAKVSSLCPECRRETIYHHYTTENFKFFQLLKGVFVRSSLTVAFVFAFCMF